MVMPISTPISEPQSVCDQIESDRIAIAGSVCVLSTAYHPVPSNTIHRFIHLLHTMYIQANVHCKGHSMLASPSDSRNDRHNELLLQRAALATSWPTASSTIVPLRHSAHPSIRQRFKPYVQYLFFVCILHTGCTFWCIPLMCTFGVPFDV